MYVVDDMSKHKYSALSGFHTVQVSLKFGTFRLYKHKSESMKFYSIAYLQTELQAQVSLGVENIYYRIHHENCYQPLTSIPEDW